MQELRQERRCRVEPLIDEIARHPSVDEVHVRSSRSWTWTRVAPDDPEDAGIRYGGAVLLNLVVTTDRGHETTVAWLLLEDGDLITHVELAGDKPYDVVRIVAEAFDL
jgi:hypothetical protein